MICVFHFLVYHIATFDPCEDHCILAINKSKVAYAMPEASLFITGYQH